MNFIDYTQLPPLKSRQRDEDAEPAEQGAAPSAVAQGLPVKRIPLMKPKLDALPQDAIDKARVKGSTGNLKG